MDGPLVNIGLQQHDEKMLGNQCFPFKALYYTEHVETTHVYAACACKYNTTSNMEIKLYYTPIL